MRHSRQLSVTGGNGQSKLRGSKIAVAGLGGLGCNVITHLASAGVGNFILIDNQSIEESNLNRQFVYSDKDVGKRKTEVSAEWVKRICPYSDTTELDIEINEKSVDMIGDCDLLIDCLDNYRSRMDLNRYAFRSKIKMIHGGIEAMYGQVTVVVPGVTPCLECILPRRDVSEVPSISPTAGIIGSLQAAEAIKVLTGKCSPLEGKLFTADVSVNSYRITEIKKNDACGCCAKI